MVRVLFSGRMECDGVRPVLALAPAQAVLERWELLAVSQEGRGKGRQRRSFFPKKGKKPRGIRGPEGIPCAARHEKLRGSHQMLLVIERTKRRCRELPQVFRPFRLNDAGPAKRVLGQRREYLEKLELIIEVVLEPEVDLIML